VIVASVPALPRANDGRFFRSSLLIAVLSKFTVAGDQDMIDAVKEAYVNRPHLVENAPGFVRLDVIRQVDNPAAFWLLTYWESEEAFRQWYQTHQYHSAHAAIPDKLKLVPHSTELQIFEYIGS
jgi:heme-degrading monooxygenase HmoA